MQLLSCHEIVSSVQVNPDDIRLESVKNEAGVAIPRVLGVGAHGKVRQLDVDQVAIYISLLSTASNSRDCLGNECN